MADEEIRLSQLPAAIAPVPEDGLPIYQPGRALGLQTGLVTVAQLAEALGGEVALAGLPILLHEYATDPDDATDGVQAAVDLATASGRQIWVTPGPGPGGSYVLIPKPTIRYYWGPGPGSGSDHPTYVAVNLLAGGLHMVGAGGKFLAGGVGSAATGARNILFSTERLETQGALADFTFEGIEFDFGNVDVYSVQFWGTDRVRFRRGKWHSTPIGNPWRGWGITFLECRDVRVIDCDFRKIRQAWEARFTYGVQLKDLRFETVGECIDIGYWVSRIQCDGHYASGCGQIWDISHVVDGEFTNLIFENCAQAAFVYDKSQTPDSLAAWLAGTAPTPAYQTTKRVTIRGIRGRNLTPVGSEQALLFQIGVNRDVLPTHGMAALQGVVIEDVNVEGAGGIIRIWEGEVTMRRVRLFGMPLVGATADQAAIYAPGVENVSGLFDDGDSFLKLDLEDVEIVDSNGQGLFVQRPDKLRLCRVKVNGYNLARNSSFGHNAIAIKKSDHDAENPARIEIENLHVERPGGDVGPVSNDTDFLVQGDGVTVGEIYDRGGHRFRGPNPFLLTSAPGDLDKQTNKAFLPLRRIEVRDSIDLTSATGVSTKEIPIHAVQRGGYRLISAWLAATATAGIPGHASNYISWTISRRRGAAGAVSQVDAGGGGFTSAVTDPNTPVDLGLEALEPNMLGQAGDSFVLRLVRNGTGQVMPPFVLTLSELEWT